MEEKKGRVRIRSEVVPVYWDVDGKGKIWLQVAVADHELRDILKRSRQARKVVDIFSKNYSDEEVYELSHSFLEEVMAKTGRNIRCATKSRISAKERQQFENSFKETSSGEQKTGRSRGKNAYDRQAIENLALSQKEPFQALVIQRQVNNCSLATIRMVLGALVKVGKLRSIPKLGYVPANYDGDIKLTRKQHSRRK